MLALADHIESFAGNIPDCHAIVPLVLCANEELVFGGECNSAALANKPNKCHLALYPPKIARAPIIMERWMAQAGTGCELLRCFALQGRQAVRDVNGDLHLLHRFVELLLCFEGVGPKQETVQKTVQVFHHPVAPGPWWWACCFAACAFSSAFRGFKLAPAKWRCLVPGERRDGAQSHPPAGKANR